MMKIFDMSKNYQIFNTQLYYYIIAKNVTLVNSKRHLVHNFTEKISTANCGA